MNKHQQRSAETQNQILNAAATCFANSGYDGTSVAEICQAAGVSKGAFYHHFPSKQAVFLALMERWLSGMDDQLQVLGGEQPDIPKRLLSMTHIVGRLLQVPNRELLIYLAFINQATRDPDIWQAAIEPYHRYRDVVAGIIAAGINQGSLQAVDPQTAASVVVALALGLLIQGFLDPEGADWPTVSQTGMRIVLEGLLAT